MATAGKRAPLNLPRGRLALLAGLAALLLIGGLVLVRPASPSAILAPSTDDATTLRFLVFGRQGYGDRHTRKAAAAMERAAAEHPVHAVLLLGDNFYPDGVASVTDRQWRSHFERRYAGPHLSGTPFFAVLGNHDHLGDAEAQVTYGSGRLGSGRWRMAGLQYARDFGRSGPRALARVVFLDTPTVRPGAARDQAFLREAFAAPGDPVWRIVVAHNPARSLTGMDYKQRRVLDELLPVLREQRVDLYLSGDDWFQQIIDVAGEPLHVSPNGGTAKVEKVQADPAAGAQAAAVGGFGVLEIDPDRLHVELRDLDGRPTLGADRSRQPAAQTPAKG